MLEFPENLIEQIARVAHEANRAYCQSIGDTSQVPWDEAPVWQKHSALTGVAKILRGEIAHPRLSHESWLAEKIKDGWTYGPVKDPIAKTHPCMVDFFDLPVAQQKKDYLFFAVVMALHPGFTAQSIHPTA